MPSSGSMMRTEGNRDAAHSFHRRHQGQTLRVVEGAVPAVLALPARPGPPDTTDLAALVQSPSPKRTLVSRAHVKGHPGSGRTPGPHVPPRLCHAARTVTVLLD